MTGISVGKYGAVSEKIIRLEMHGFFSIKESSTQFVGHPAHISAIQWKYIIQVIFLIKNTI